MLSLNSQLNNCRSTVNPIKLPAIIRILLALIHNPVSSEMKEAPLMPLINIKYTMAVIAKPP